MPTLPLTTYYPPTVLRVEDTGGPPVEIPLPQFRCLSYLPGVLLPRDAIIDTGSPLSWLPEAVWNRMREGTDYEVLPWSSGFIPPPSRTAGWNFTFRIARLLQPIRLFTLASPVEVVRDRVLVQLAHGNPPASPRSNAPPRVVLGLWGGVLEGTAIRIVADPTTGHVGGALEW